MSKLFEENASDLSLTVAFLCAGTDFLHDFHVAVEEECRIILGAKLMLRWLFVCEHDKSAVNGVR